MSWLRRPRPSTPATSGCDVGCARRSAHQFSIRAEILGAADDDDEFAAFSVQRRTIPVAAPGGRSEIKMVPFDEPQAAVANGRHALVAKPVVVNEFDKTWLLIGRSVSRFRPTRPSARGLRASVGMRRVVSARSW